MSAPRTKRPFAGDASQRQITNFFPRTASSAASDLAAVLSTTHLAGEPASPVHLPPAVQANLLSVGMRVRKSVPEGYKTGSDAGAFALWSDAGPAPSTGPYSQSYTPGFAYSPSQPSQHQDPRQFVLQPPITSIHPSASTAVVSSRRELLPFCGLHRVGGMAAQPDAPGGGVVFADEVFGAAPPAANRVPGLTMSQDSASSATPDSSQYGYGPGAGRKRSYGCVDTDAGRRPQQPRDGDADWDGDGDGDVSPRTVVAPSPFAADGMADGSGNGNGRAIAVPRRRSRKEHGGGGLGQENVVVAGSADDFNDAEFFVWGDGGRRRAVDFEMDDV